MKTEMISRILTSLDEAFMLLYIRVHYGNNTNFVLEEGDEIKCYLLKSGWQEAGILMHNTFYHRIVANCSKNKD